MSTARDFLAQGGRRLHHQKMRAILSSLVLLIGSANSLSLGLAPARRSAVHRIVMQVSQRQPHWLSMRQQN